MKRYTEKEANVRSKKGVNLVLTLFLWLFLAVFVVSAGMIVYTTVRGQKEEKVFEQLGQLVEQQRQTMADHPKPENPSDAAGEPPFTEYQALYEMNEDFVGWLTVPGTRVDYPVMYTPNWREYYLRRNFYRQYSLSGTPFVGEDASPDSDVFIIHGHNMKNGSMFWTLHDYEDADFYAEHPNFCFTTPTERREYEIFAAVKTRILFEDEDGFRWYRQGGEQTEEEFTALTDWIAEHAMYETGVAPQYGEQIVLLSTCSYHTENGRFFIAARRVEPDA